MGIVKIPKPVKFFASIIFKDNRGLQSAEREIRQAVGDIQERTVPVPFYFTDYYEKEMGSGLMRLFLLLEPFSPREGLPAVKLKTNEIEASLLSEGKRTVNIDPGYISLENVVLATTKGYAHRIYIGNGIYADLTLTYHNGTYRPLEWTYPDYGSVETISLLNKWRGNLKEKTRE